MKYKDKITLKNGKDCIIRNATAEDAAEMTSFFVAALGETDYLLSYPEEHLSSEDSEREYLKTTSESNNEIELLAVVDGKIIARAGIRALGSRYKIRHRSELGITVSKNYWGQGIGSNLMNACIACARQAGYTQLELDVVSDNERAISLYKKLGFMEYGCNPKGFQSKYSGFQELIYMRLEL